ncbi:MAG TPA: nuclear transport factor 2 family protein [Streptosporangiaceae bacterium]|nr:nuclear transport factor 2 family protein [Streptosporangiaceae bacterium]
MSTDVKIDTIGRVYEAFGRGDIPAVLGDVADDVDWAQETTSSAAPWYGPRHGKDEVSAFFNDFGSAMEVQEFTPLTYAANDTDVFTIVRVKARSRDTGRTMVNNVHHFFRFRNGKIAFYRGTEDTAQVEDVLRSS